MRIFVNIVRLAAVFGTLALINRCATADGPREYESPTRVTPLVCEPPEHAICVRVVSTQGLQNLSGVAVFIVNRTGQEIARALTDERGVATLAVSPDVGGFAMVEIVPGVITAVRLRPSSHAYFITSCGAQMP
jgi:hypothetical protein